MGVISIRREEKGCVDLSRMNHQNHQESIGDEGGDRQYESASFGSKEFWQSLGRVEEASQRN